MNNLLIKIGDHIIHISCNSDNLTNLFNKNYQTLPQYHKKPDINLTINGNYGTAFVNYSVEMTKGIDKIYFKRADYLIEVSHDYSKATISVYDQFALKHALMNLYSSFIVHHNWGLLIHSSCVLENEKAHIFAGKSGDGKSTAARLSMPRDLLSDEASIIKITPSSITAYHSPFRSELETSVIKECSLLSSIHILHQSIINNRIKLKKTDGLLHLLDKVFYWTNSPDDLKKVMNLLNTLVTYVPIYKLEFQKNNTFWELIS